MTRCESIAGTRLPLVPPCLLWPLKWQFHEFSDSDQVLGRWPLFSFRRESIHLAAAAPICRFRCSYISSVFCMLAVRLSAA